ncbi:bifunctional UDP-N-acetylglucosamine diphosphorylase/glucosamine-1-phosphate N-acetyltransferase GlmU [Syntrophomonas zehnderi]|uniref:bifunctional UDP-N-acetylglucosamine diphosphorylase/glucosamine-1-phosphate N-acetyltransferase GlmU n=1 Tax=Syntrophomonas zehnderi TaxID=404335 RepID=UPI00097986F7|nr:bifunctional UDP-N-acetylglucosamine diphosphorylase/glucosamine-1-phosphate N-acetyltransferase GlmU [Syntrophomonas zehnderi]
MNCSAVILAAGKGVRMHSNYPKVVHRVAGTPMIVHVVNAVTEAGIEKITLVVGHQQELIKALFVGQEVNFANQAEQLGTGHALLQARDIVQDDDMILVTAGDTPLLQAQTLEALIKHHQQSQATATILSTRLNNPSGYGRIVRNENGVFLRIVEEKDATPDEKRINEINSGMYCFQVKEAFKALSALSSGNAQGEYYLTDILEILRQDRQRVEVLCLDAKEDIYGINNREQLAWAEKIMRQRINQELMLSGVTMIDPDSTYIDAGIKIGMDTTIYPSCIIEGNSRIGEGCEIGPGTRISDSIIGNHVSIENSRIKEARVGDNCTIGPYAYLRPQAVLETGVKVGDFVEIKKSTIGAGSKIPHLSYIGDAKLGQGVNVGAGTITCNYDGKNKWPTLLEDGVFIGSNTNLVAPVRIGAHAVTGAGSTITKDVPPQALGLERAEQKNILDWKSGKRD